MLYIAHELLLLQVQLNQALSSPELSTSDQLDATLSTMRDMCEHLGERLTYIALCVYFCLVILCHCYLDSMTLLAGPFRDVSMKVCELVRSMTFESCAHDPVAGCTRPLCSAIHSRVCCSCVLLKVDKLEKQIDHQNNKLQQMTHNLERVMLPESRKRQPALHPGNPRESLSVLLSTSSLVLNHPAYPHESA